MKKLIAITLVSVLFTGTAFTPDVKQDPVTKVDPVTYNFRKVNNNAFQPGEVLKYRLHYGLIDAGIATLQVKETKKKVAGREMLHVVGTGRSKGTFDFFFKVRDRYETYMDAEGMFPWLFIRRVDEGGYKINQDYKFIQHKKVVHTNKGQKFKTPENIQDMLSALYYARTLDLTNIRKGDIVSVPCFVDDEVYPMKIKYAGTATVKLKRKRYKCMKFHPVVQKGRIFKSQEDLSVYISNDENKIPILAKAKVLVGSIKMELTGYEGLKSPLAMADK